MRTVVSDDMADRRRFDARPRALLTLPRGLGGGPPRIPVRRAVLALLEHGAAAASGSPTSPRCPADESRASRGSAWPTTSPDAVLLPYRFFLARRRADRLRHRRCSRTASASAIETGLPSAEHAPAPRRGAASRSSSCAWTGPATSPSATRRPTSTSRGSAAPAPCGTSTRRFSSPEQLHAPRSRGCPTGAPTCGSARTDRPASGRLRRARAAQFAVALGCDVRHAPRLVYARGLALDDPATAVPDRLRVPALRARSAARSAPFPLVGRPLDIDRGPRARGPTPPPQAGGQRSSGSAGGRACPRRRSRPGSPAS